ncbi:hypothetical protein FUA23_22045 [Neolewinella aurantiaca]|uniref:Uncharacterized protein n=1 Tax=Neolewinella aurantiaca TaxID=2602767 RepID=A0A5C7F2B2_9BACT|nr:hypothetical protein [Neolewinella aurantiaca]TXF81187.1 hypothetical protein FUA23_22045 [Neolewinella aurantiaca]
MKMLFFYGFVLFIFFFSTCKKPDPIYPILENPVLVPSELTNREVDVNRICIGTLVRDLLKLPSFLEHLKVNTSTSSNIFNQEYCLLTNLGSRITPELTLKELIDITLEQNASPCFSTLEDFESALLEDPLLVIKIPDIINIQEWNTSRDVPFVYVKTTTTVSSPKDPSQFGYLGLHHSGAIDLYNNGVPTYFPLVLKSSEDFIAMDRFLNCHNGIQFDQLHSSFNRLSNREEILSRGIEVEGSELTIIKVNDLLQNSNQLLNLYGSETDLTTCSSQCSYSCLIYEERKLLGEEIFIHNNNSNVLDYEYKSAFRPGDLTIFYDNIVPILSVQKNRDGGNELSKNILLGSFRINQFFLSNRTADTESITYDIGGQVMPITKVHFLLEATEKISLNTVQNNNLILLDDIMENDKLTLSTMRVSLDYPIQTINLINGLPLSIHNAWRDNVLNYDLFCLDEEGMLGFNSISIKYSF